MKTRIPFKLHFDQSFFQQLFFYCILIGLIPGILIFSDLLSPNLPSFEGYLSGQNIGSDLFSKGIEQGINTFKGGLSFNIYTKSFLLILLVASLIASVAWLFKEKKAKKSVFLFHAFIMAILAYFELETGGVLRYVTTILDASWDQQKEIFEYFYSLDDKGITEFKNRFNLTNFYLLKIACIIFLVLVYPIFSLFSAFHFIKKGHIRSNAFLWALVTVTILFGVPNAILFGLLGVMLRFIYLVFKQNIDIVRTLKIKRFAFLFLKSLIFWLPLLLFVIPGNNLSNSIYEGSINGIYTHIFKRDDGERGLKKKYFIADTNKYLDDLFAPLEGEQLRAKSLALEKRIEDDFDEIAESVGNKSEDLPKAISKRYRKELMKTFVEIAPFFAQEDCGFHIIVPTSCCIMNGAKSFLFSKCVELGNDLGKMIEKDLAEAITTGSGNTQEELEKNKKIIIERIRKNRELFENKVADLKSKLKSSILGLYNSIILFNLIMDLLLFFLIVKSFMVVFARVAFSGQDDIYVTLLEADKRMAKGDIKKCGSQYTILSSNTKDFYTSRLYEPSGRPPKYTIPQKLSVIFGRLRTRNYALNHVVMRNRTGSVYYNALGGTQFVEWTLKPSEEVIFSLDNFVAMSEEVTLTTTYSFRLTSLLLGRFRFTTAKGPGKLVLLTKGEPVTSHQRKGSASVPVSRIIAFQKNTRFHVHSELNFIDVFLSSIYLQKKPGDLIVIDADEKGSAKSGISKFIKGFLLPI